MFKMGFTDTTICPHCAQNTTDNYLHATWNCTPIKQFWQDITNNLSLTMDCHIPLSPALCLLGDTSGINLDNTSSRTLSIALTIAKKTILMNWKSRKKINIAIWKNLLIEHISMEKLSASLKNPPTFWG